jgi:hypothetical protein
MAAGALFKGTDSGTGNISRCECAAQAFANWYRAKLVTTGKSRHARPSAREGNESNVAPTNYKILSSHSGLESSSTKSKTSKGFVQAALTEVFGVDDADVTDDETSDGSAETK